LQLCAFYGQHQNSTSSHQALESKGQNSANLNFLVCKVQITRLRNKFFMVAVIDSESNLAESSHGRGHRVVFLREILNYHSPSLHAGVLIKTGDFDGGGNPATD